MPALGSAEACTSDSVAGEPVGGAVATTGGWGAGWGGAVPGEVVGRWSAAAAAAATPPSAGSRRRFAFGVAVEGVSGGSRVEAASTGSAATAAGGIGGAFVRRGGVRILAHAPVTAKGCIGTSASIGSGGGCSAAGGGAGAGAADVSSASMPGCAGACSIVVGGAGAGAGGRCCSGGGSSASGGGGAGAAGGGAAGAGAGAAEEVVVEELGPVRGVVAAYARHPARATAHVRAPRRRTMRLASHRASSKSFFLDCAVVQRTPLAAGERLVCGAVILMQAAPCRAAAARAPSRTARMRKNSRRVAASARESRRARSTSNAAASAADQGGVAMERGCEGRRLPNLCFVAETETSTVYRMLEIIEKLRYMYILGDDW